MNHLDLAQLRLRSGIHTPNDDGEMCVMEAVAYFAHEPWSDRPRCASRVITNFCIAWNDAMNDRDRQMLKPYIPKIVGTAASKDVELRRAWMALDWSCRVSTPAWLRLAGLEDEAKALEVCAPIVDAASAKAARGALDRAKREADAAWAAAWDAAGDAAWAAAWDAAGDAAWAAAWAAAGDAAWAAARAAARAAAWAAARAAAGDAAWAAASKKLRPTVRRLQKSALELLDRMIEEGAA